MNNNTSKILDLITEKIKSVKLIKEPRSLYEPVDYCLKNGGKRIRPQMTLLGCDLFSGNIENAVNAAIGLELLHNFTLMHDDIMDEAPIRRGQPSVFKKWGTNAAILSGDAMLAVAYSYMMKVPAECLKEVLTVFNNTIIEVCEGQQYDLDFEEKNDVSESDYLNMIRLKTAVLPANCLKIGGLISQKANEEDLFNLYKFGEMIGLAFQIQDDRLDVYANEELFGKKTGGDIIANKKTWLYIKALEIANENQKKSLLDLYSNKTNNNKEKISSVKNIYNNLNIDKLSVEKINYYFDKALLYLGKISVKSESKTPLRMLAKDLLNREY